MYKDKKVLISVYDKRGIVEFSKSLNQLGWEIISTGGTYRKLEENNIPVIEISDYTNFPECLDGRVKTLHPKIEGGILGVRTNNDHLKQMNKLGIETIDMVVCNLYPFKETLLSESSSHDDIIENIDIGGPTMLRAAAKNYKFVTVIVDTVDYKNVLDELRTNGDISILTKEKLAAKVFQHTAHYDALISGYFNEKNDTTSSKTVTLTFEKIKSLRYGENPHQTATFYASIKDKEGTLANAKQLHGKELSYNNIGDTDGVIETLKEFEEPTVVACKHANPCGVGSADTIAEAYQKAYNADPVSIFGGIVAANREIDRNCAEKLQKIFLEVLVAPGFTKDALAILTQKKNIRILQLEDITKPYNQTKFRTVMGGLLEQSYDSKLLNDGYDVVTERKPNKNELEDLFFAWKIVKHAKSNGIVLAKQKQTVGVGPGQVSRIWALENAVRQAGEKVKKSVMASDAFFPFDDCVQFAHKSGITAIIQPGGSIRDKDSINAANKYGISMIFTGIRHFKH